MISVRIETDNPQFPISIIDHAKDTNPRPCPDGWDVLLDAMQSASRRIGRSKDGPAFCPATFGDVLNDKGNLRHDGNVTTYTAIVLDLDGKGESIDPDDLRRRAEAFDRTCLAYTTWQSTPKAFRWRLVFPLAEAIVSDPKTMGVVIKATADYVARSLGLRERDVSVDRPSGLFFMPRTPDPFSFDCFHGVADQRLEAIKPSNQRRTLATGGGRDIPSNSPDEHSHKPGGNIVIKPPPLYDYVQDDYVQDDYVHPGPADDGRLLTFSRVFDLFNQSAVSRRIAAHLGLPDVPLRSMFRSPLPWRQDKNPSANLMHDAGKAMILYDYGDPEHKAYTLVQFARCLTTGKPDPRGCRKQSLLNVLWAVRLLIESGVLAPGDTSDLPSLPDDASKNDVNVYEGWRLLWACKRRVEGWDGPTHFTRPFICEWCQVRDSIAAKAQKNLHMKHRVIRIVNTSKGSHGKDVCEFLPGDHRKVGLSGIAVDTTLTD